MDGQRTNSTETIDGKTSRSICNAVGERLQQSLRPDVSQLPDSLRRLVDALRRQDAEVSRR
jgi:hypothetical protein